MGGWGGGLSNYSISSWPWFVKSKVLGIKLGLARAKELDNNEKSWLYAKNEKFSLIYIVIFHNKPEFFIISHFSLYDLLLCLKHYKVQYSRYKNAMGMVGKS